MIDDQKLDASPPTVHELVRRCFTVDAMQWRFFGGEEGPWNGGTRSLTSITATSTSPSEWNTVSSGL
ncbi:hypothetical protein, partial [Streptomyces pilosus]|uniref:hypothetical protein n=1 Tax=Streptomyces pilosus TaxID=28893 RepID=UPI001C84BFAD